MHGDDCQLFYFERLDGVGYKVIGTIAICKFILDRYMVKALFSTPEDPC
jgi:hypothetical protein